MTTETNEQPIGPKSQALGPMVCGFTAADGDIGGDPLDSRGSLGLHRSRPVQRDTHSFSSPSRFSAGPGWWPECISFAPSAQEVRVVACKLCVSMLRASCFPESPPLTSPWGWLPLLVPFLLPRGDVLFGILFPRRIPWLPGQTSVSGCQ